MGGAFSGLRLVCGAPWEAGVLLIPASGMSKHSEHPPLGSSPLNLWVQLVQDVHHSCLGIFFQALDTHSAGLGAAELHQVSKFYMTVVDSDARLPPCP